MNAADYFMLAAFAFGFGIALFGIAVLWCAVIVSFGEWATKTIHRWLTWS